MPLESDSLVEDGANPYIALADLAINLVLVLAFFVAAVNALGRAGWEQIRYKDMQAEFRRAVETLPKAERPQENLGKNDPPGVQRWVFSGSGLFKPGTAHFVQPVWQGSHPLASFARLLKENQRQWRRIRVEGHTKPPNPGAPDEWELSAARAAMVTKVIAVRGHIPPHFLAVAGRAGQDPMNKASPGDPSNERVEVLVEYTQPGSSSALP